MDNAEEARPPHDTSAPIPAEALRRRLRRIALAAVGLGLVALAVIGVASVSLNRPVGLMTPEEYIRSGHRLFNGGEYAEAETFFRNAVSACEAPGGSLQNLTRGLQGLAMVYDAQGRKEEAVTALNRAARAAEERCGTHSAEAGDAQSELGRLYVAHGDMEPARRALDSALLCYRQALGPHHPKVGGTLSNLAALLEQQKDFAGAEDLYKESLAILGQAAPARYPDFAYTMWNLGYMYSIQGRMEEAERCMRQAIEIVQEEAGSRDARLPRLLEVYRDVARSVPGARGAPPDGALP